MTTGALRLLSHLIAVAMYEAGDERARRLAEAKERRMFALKRLG